MMEKTNKVNRRRCFSAVDFNISPLVNNRRQLFVKSYADLAKRNINSSDDSFSAEINSQTSSQQQKPSLQTSNNDEQQRFKLLIETIRARSNDLNKAWSVISPDDDPERRMLFIHFRLFIDFLCFPTNEQLFQLVLQHLRTSNTNAISHQQFFTRFLDQSFINFESSYKYLDRTAPLEEVEVLLINRIIENVTCICRMLQMLDRHQSGFIPISEMQKIIHHCCHMQLHDNTYNKLWLRYDPHHTETIDYRDFLKRLAINVSNYKKTCNNLNMKTALTWPEVEAMQNDSHHKRLAILKGEDDQQIKRMASIDDIRTQLQLKLCTVDNILTKAFLVLDSNNTGSVPYEAFRILLSYFTFALSQKTFDRLITNLGFANTDTIEWKTALSKMKEQLPARAYSAPAITCKRPTRLNSSNKLTKRVMPLNLPLVDQIYMAMSQCDKSHGPQLLHHFNYKLGLEPCITRQELRMVLNKLGIRMNQQQFKQLTIILDPDHTNIITHSSFKQLFPRVEENQESPTLLEVESSKCSPKIPSEINYKVSNRLIPWPNLLAKLKERVHINYDNIEKVLRACDYKHLGLVTPGQLRKLLHHFCYRLSNEEFSKLIYVLQDVNGMINVRKFNETFYQTEKERLQKWSALITRLTKPCAAHLWSHSQLDVMWTQLLHTFASSLVNQLKKVQLDQQFQVPRLEYRKILSHYTGWLYEEEFDYLWDTYLCSAKDNLEKLIVAEEPQVTTDCKSVVSYEVLSTARSRDLESCARSRSERSWQRSASTKSHTNVQSKRSDLRSKTAGPRSYFSADLRIRQIMAQRWKDFKEECLALDVNQNYTITSQSFLDILRNLGVPVTSQHLLNLLPHRYGVQVMDPQAPVQYITFLTNLFLTKTTNKMLPNHVGNILLDLRSSVLCQWKTLRKIFRRHDVLGTGSISVSKFLSILKCQDVVLNENEVKLLIHYLDPQTTGGIHYRDFLHIFMKSVV